MTSSTSRTRSRGLAGLTLLALLPAPAAAAPPPDPVPVFRAHCGRCHGGAKPKSGLDLQSLSGVARGGDGGAVVAPGRPQDSRLWQEVSAGRMPPKAPLPKDQQEVLRRWIAAGAPGLAAAPRDHWAFRPLAAPKAPPVRDASRARTAVDRHLQAALEAKGLSLSADADPARQLRRLSFGLTGLPPTAEDLAAFLADGAPGAYERMAEKYLASPRYAEHWGKHWLDAAGYADSNGYFSADTPRPHAWRYRDWVIRSFQADKPFDRFLREQLAGDELAYAKGFRTGQPATPEVIELLEATHFLRNGQDGTDDSVNEAEAHEIDRRATLEATVQVTLSSLLGLTAHCARCHDHKFEPIAQTEYYQLQAVFFPAFNPGDWVKPVDRVLHVHLPGEKEEWEQRERDLVARIAAARKAHADWVRANREPGEVLFRDDFESAGGKLAPRWSATAPGDDGPGGAVGVDREVPGGAFVRGGRLHVLAGAGEGWLSTTAAFDWRPARAGEWVQATFDLVDNKIGGAPAERVGYTLAAHDFNDSGKVAGGNILVDGNPTTSTNLYVDYPGSDHRLPGAVGAVGYRPGHNYGVRVTKRGDDQYQIEHLVDGAPEGKSLELKAADLPRGGFAFFYCNGRSFVVDNVVVERAGGGWDAARRAAFLKESRARHEAMLREVERLQKRRTPAPGRAIAWVSDRSARPPVVPFLKRGNYFDRGAGVRPSALACLTDAGHPFAVGAPEGGPTTGRRTAFADWLLRPGSRPAALVARVHVNRVWQRTFGRGLVETTDNLGQSGAPPSHPDLLEYLAGEFVRSGWSQKALHRLLVASTAFRQSADPRPEGMRADPDDRLLWRWPLRRLEAESIRDGMLAASGELDVARGGPFVATRQTPVGEVVVDESAAGARRRSVYLQQRRSQTLSLLRVFDAPAVATVCTSRPSSAVPLQPLAQLNSDFARSRAEALARRVRAAGDDPVRQAEAAFRLTASRPPTDGERAALAEFLREQPARYPTDGPRRALIDLCQVLLAGNAFLYLD